MTNHNTEAFGAHSDSVRKKSAGAVAKSRAIELLKRLPVSERAMADQIGWHIDGPRASNRRVPDRAPPHVAGTPLLLAVFTVEPAPRHPDHVGVWLRIHENA